MPCLRLAGAHHRGGELRYDGDANSHGESHFKQWLVAHFLMLLALTTAEATGQFLWRSLANSARHCPWPHGGGSLPYQWAPGRLF